MADAELIHTVEAAINQMQDSLVDAQSTLSAFTDHGIRTTWQLLALSDSDWQTVAPGLSIGMRAAIKALAARPMTQRQPAVMKENADPITEQQVEHAFWDDAKKFFGSTEVWVSVDTPWLQRLACSGQDPRSLRSAVCAWMEGYSITWLLFFATVTPTIFSIMRPVGHLDPSYSNRAENSSTVDASSSSPRYGYASAEPQLNFVFALSLFGFHHLRTVDSDIHCQIDDAHNQLALGRKLLPLARDASPSADRKGVGHEHSCQPLDDPVGASGDAARLLLCRRPERRPGLVGHPAFACDYRGGDLVHMG